MPCQPTRSPICSRSSCVLQSVACPAPSFRCNSKGSVPRYVCLERHRGRKGQSPQSLTTFRQWLDLHQQDPSLDAQLLPVTLLWHRAPGKERPAPLQPPVRLPGRLRKALMVLLYGRENRVRFSLPVSLRQLLSDHGSDEQMAHKLARVARIHFSRQRHAAKGPSLPDRQALFNDLLRNPAISQAIQEQATQEQVSEEKMRQRAHHYLDEMASDFSYRLVRFADYFLGWVWNKLYRGITVAGGRRSAVWRAKATKSSICPAIAAIWTICCSPTSSITRGWCRRISPPVST